MFGVPRARGCGAGKTSESVGLSFISSISSTISSQGLAALATDTAGPPVPAADAWWCLPAAAKSLSSLPLLRRLCWSLVLLLLVVSSRSPPLDPPPVVADDLVDTDPP